jgi:hypothetical protein
MIFLLVGQKDHQVIMVHPNWFFQIYMAIFLTPIILDFFGLKNPIKKHVFVVVIIVKNLL